MEKMEKIVFSKTIKNSDWQNTRVLQNLIPPEIKSLKEITERNIVVFGSPNLATQLIRSGLADEYYFIVQPVIFGMGGRLFKDGDLESRQLLKLVDTKVYDSGAITIHYQFDR
jgi:dihydrofolate reductase